MLPYQRAALHFLTARSSAGDFATIAEEKAATFATLAKPFNRQRQMGRHWRGKGSSGGWGGGNKPFWRKFVDPSDDPQVIAWCRQRVQQFLDGGANEEQVEWLGNEYRNTLRELAPKMGAGWMKIAKGTFALVRTSDQVVDASDLKVQLVKALRELCERSGGRCTAKNAWWSLPTSLQVDVSVKLQLKNWKGLPEICQNELQAAGLRMNARRNTFLLGEDDGFEDAVFVGFDAQRMSSARKVLDLALKRLPVSRKRKRDQMHSSFLQGDHNIMDSSVLNRERALPGYQQMLQARGRLPAFKMAKQICATVRSEQVTLVLGATGCGKTTQIPQFILEDVARRDMPCRILASQPRRISAVSVAERVATERGGKLGDTVAFKIRFEDNISETTQLIFCTVGIILKLMQSNPNLEGATHIIVDEVHERDLHTDFLLTLLRRVLRKRADLKLILMSATVDPSAFQEYFPEAKMISIPGKTNYPIEEFFLEDVLQALPDRARWRQSREASRTKVSAFSQGPLPGVPLDQEAVSIALPELAADVAADLARVHAMPPEEVDFDMVQLVVEMIHASGEEGGILIFMPGWFEIVEIMKRLEGSKFYTHFDVHPLHSRLPTVEQQAIFRPSPPGRRKVVVATILAETSITVEDIVYVIDTGRSRSTFFNDQSKVSALRTVWYSKANGFQRRGRAGRCRPGTWYRLFSSLQWEVMQEYELPEMLRSPLEELCLEVASLSLGEPLEFLSEAISPPKEDVIIHAVNLLFNLGAVTDAHGATLTPLGEKLSKLQVHPMLGKMLLIAGLFRCFEPMLTICASLGYKSPFLCPMGKEKEANAAKAYLADGSNSDLVALANAYEGWCSGKARFANQYFLSHQTMDYIHRLRRDLQGAAKDVLTNIPADHSDRLYCSDVCRAVLVAGLFPNLAWIKQRGKGHTLQSLKVCVHPGSVNSRVQGSVVAFYGIQETTERWMYDTTVVSMAPCLLFAPELEELHRGHRVVFRLSAWMVAVDPHVADDLLALRASIAEFINRSVGQESSPEHLEATDALSTIFSEHAPLHSGDLEDEDAAPENTEEPSLEHSEQDVGMQGLATEEEVANLSDVGDLFVSGEEVECYWPDDDSWLLATVVKVHADGSMKIRWVDDPSLSDVPTDYVRKT